MQITRLEPWWNSDGLTHPQAPLERHVAGGRPARVPVATQLLETQDEVTVVCELDEGVGEIELEYRTGRLVLHGQRDGRSFSRAQHVPHDLDAARQRVRISDHAVIVTIPRMPVSRWRTGWQLARLWLSSLLDFLRGSRSSAADTR